MIDWATQIHLVLFTGNDQETSQTNSPPSSQPDWSIDEFITDGILSKYNSLKYPVIFS